MNDKANHTLPDSVEAMIATLRSSDMVAVVRMIGELTRVVQNDPALRAPVIDTLQPLALTTADPHVANVAGKAIEQLGDKATYRKVWLSLLNDPRLLIALNAVHVTTDASWLATLIDLLSTRSEVAVRQAILLSIGKMKDRSALPLLVAHLSDSDLKGYAVLALTNLGDPQAIPHLQLYLADKTPLWPLDNHGPMELMGEAVASSIKQLQVGTARAHSTAQVRPAAPANKAANQVHWIAFGPLAAVLTTVGAFMLMAIIVLGKRGQDGASAHTQWLVDLAITFPGLLGLLCGVAAMKRFKLLSPIERSACIVGMLVSGLIAKSFITTLLR